MANDEKKRFISQVFVKQFWGMITRIRSSRAPLVADPEIRALAGRTSRVVQLISLVNLFARQQKSNGNCAYFFFISDPAVQKNICK